MSWSLILVVLATMQAPPSVGGNDLKDEFLAKRAKTPKNAAAHYQLGLWCEQNGLKAEAESEFRSVLALDAKHRGAREKLGYTLHKGRWLTAAEIAEDEEQVKADKVWYPRLRELHDDLRGRDAKKQAGAETELGKIDDPRAVPALWFTFATGGEADQALAVRLLGQARSPSSSRALAAILLFSPSDEVARQALETLRGREPTEFARPIVSLLRQPWTFRLKPFGGVRQIETEMVLSAETFVTQRFYKSNSQPAGSRPAIGPPSAGLRQSLARSAARSLTDATAYFQVTHYARENAEMNEVFAGSRLVLAEDTAAIERRNDEVKEANRRVMDLLSQLFPKAKSENFDGWRAWLIEIEEQAGPGNAARIAGLDHLFANPTGHPKQPIKHHPACAGSRGH